MRTAPVIVAAFVGCAAAFAQVPQPAAEAKPAPPKAVVSEEGVSGHTDTPVLPGTRWHVHDPFRPQPPIVRPGSCCAEGVAPPSDAIVLFDGGNLDKWDNPGNWTVRDGWVEVVKKPLTTRDAFGDCQLHIEWVAPENATGSGQQRGNSGVFMMGMFEIQILDSFENKTYPDGQAGALYGAHPPLVNPSRKPGEWQEYDIVFRAPRFDGGRLVAPARATVFYNGVLVQADAEFPGPTVHGRLASYGKPVGPKGPIQLQEHGHKVRFRNIWVRPLDLPGELPAR